LLGFKVDDSGREQYNKGIDETKQKQQSLTASLLKANIIMGVAQKALGAAFGFVKDSVIGATAETERYRTIIGSLIGDQEKANQIIHDLDYSPVSDFYGTAAAIGGLRSFVTMGMDAEKASEQMTLLGDVAQGNSEAFNLLSANMAQVYSKGKADAMDLKQFMAQGFDVSGVLGLSEAQKKAGVTYAQVEEALKRVTAAGGPYNNMLAKQMNTLGGVIKQFQSFKAATAEAVGTGINEELKEILKYILEIARAGQDTFVGKFVKFLKEVIHWIFQVIIMWEVLGYRLEDMGDALDPVKNFFLDLKEAAGDVLTGIMILAVEVGRLVVAAFRPIQAFISPIIKELGAIAKDVFTAIADFIRPLVPVVSDSAGFFGKLGEAISGLLRPALIAAAAITGVKTAMNIGKGVVGTIKAVQDAYGLLTGSMSVMKAAADGNRLAMLMLDAQMLKSKITTFAHAAATKIAGLATKVWSGIQMIFNAIMNANPIALIILGIAALIAGIILLVKNWDTVVAALKKAFEAIGNFFKKIWDGIKSFFVKVVEFVKKNALNIANVLLAILFFPAGVVMAVVRLIIKHWDKIKAALTKVFTFVADAAKAIWSGIVDAVKAIVEKVKAVWESVTGFFSGLWEGVKQVSGKAWDGIKNVAGKAWDGIKGAAGAAWDGMKKGAGATADFFKNRWNNIKDVGNKAFNVLDNFTGGALSRIRDNFLNLVNGVKEFFSGLWNAIKEGPAATIEFLKNAFFGLLNNIKEKFFAALDGIKAVAGKVWEGMKKGAGAAWEGIKKGAGTAWEGIKKGASATASFMRNRWEDIKGAGQKAFNFLDNFSGGALTRMKDNFFNAINKVKEFFAGLWEALKEGPAATFEFIKNAFFGLFENIKEKFFGFINTLKEGWEAVKGFFGGIGTGIKNFFTGGGDSGGGGQMQPAYASAGSSRAAMAGAVGPTSNYAYNSTGGSSTVNAQTSINVNVPSGTPQAQSEAIARQIDAQFNARLAGSINSSRANIPSPEMRRH